MAGAALRGEVLSPPTRLDSNAELFHGLTPTAKCGRRTGERSPAHTVAHGKHSPRGGRSLHSDPCGKAAGRPFALTEGECLSVWLCNLIIALCVIACLMLHRVPLHIRVSPDTRQRLQLLRTQRHLNLGSRLRALIDEPS